MKIIDKNLSWYIEKIQKGESFSIGMYGDGEWQAIFNEVWGDKFRQNAERTEYTPELSKAMAESLKFKSPNFYFAVPDMFNTIPEYRPYAALIDRTFGKFGIQPDLYEKNIWHEAMWQERLYPLIKEFRNHNVCIISNKMLRGLTFLNYDKFIEIDYPNCFHQLEDVTKQILEYGKPGIYLFACGIPATLFVQAVHGKIPNSWSLDLGSIWDGFVGIGGQRPTRRDYYMHPVLWKKFVDNNLKEIEWPREIPKVHWHGMGSLDINPKL